MVTNKLKIELCSLNRDFNYQNFDFIDNWKIVYGIVKERIKSSKADLLVFAGGALKNKSFGKLKNEFEKMKINNCLSNSNIVVAIEEWNGVMHLLNYSQGKDLNKYVQLFSEANDLEGGYSIRRRLMNELYDKMVSNIFRIKGLNCVIVQCGEINFLKGNKIRGNESDDYVKKFESMLDKQVDVVLNVIHTPMGRFWVVKDKVEWLSEKDKFQTGNKKNKACLSVINCMKNHKNKKCYNRIMGIQNMINEGCIQKAYVNGIEQSEIELYVTDDYISRVYAI